MIAGIAVSIAAIWRSAEARLERFGGSVFHQGFAGEMKLPEFEQRLLPKT